MTEEKSSLIPGPMERKIPFSRGASAVFGAVVLSSLLVGSYVALGKAGLALWVLDLLFSVALLLLWLGRRRAPILSAMGMLLTWMLTARMALGTATLFRLLGGLAAAILGLWTWKRAAAPRVSRPLGRVSLWRVLTTLTVFGLILGALAGPPRIMVDPQKRKAALRAKSMGPPDPVSDLERRLQSHVFHLADRIGERAVYQRDRIAAARDYVRDRFTSLGLPTKLIPYRMPSLGSKGTADNVEARLLPAHPNNAPIWVIGAHYDTAPDTPGADDNASGVAVLLELARLLKSRSVAAEIRLVAFSTEEPPSFGTRNMGSVHYARALKEEGVPVDAMMSLEMLGYFSDRPGSQFYPPLISRWYPEQGNFVALVGNVSSRGVVAKIRRKWRAASTFPLETLTLPAPFSGVPSRIN
ncbi:MAG: M28 family peptidase [Elusimicrobia bacterium]|nr:M28 family peptidase [Elusimicrobiota bacterium]